VLKVILIVVVVFFVYLIVKGIVCDYIDVVQDEEEQAGNARRIRELEQEEADYYTDNVQC